MTTPSSGHVGRVADLIRDPRFPEPPRDAFRLTGDSHADLERMANACAPAPATWLEEARRRERLQELIDAAGILFGAGAVEEIRRVAGRCAEDAWGLERLVDQLRWQTESLGTQLIEARGDRDRARDCAVALEQAIGAGCTDAWTWAYLQLLEEQTPAEIRERLVAAANQQVAAAAAPPPPDPASVLIDAPGLPVIDDATLDEHQLVFRRGDETVAVGKIDRLFAPLDSATEIALGASQVDGPPGAETVLVLPGGDDLTVSADDDLVWPDGTRWGRPELLAGAWLLKTTPDGEAVHVASPRSDRAAGSRRVAIGWTWGPYGDEEPRPAPPGPADPPRPPHHHPVA